jgi:hypothetical protein
MFVVQLSPSKPALQLQTYDSAGAAQCPPLKHSFSKHSRHPPSRPYVLFHGPDSSKEFCAVELSEYIWSEVKYGSKRPPIRTSPKHPCTPISNSPHYTFCHNFMRLVNKNHSYRRRKNKWNMQQKNYPQTSINKYKEENSVTLCTV